MTHYLCVFECTFFFNDTATTEIYTLSLHDALPISRTGFFKRSGSGSGSGWWFWLVENRLWEVRSRRRPRPRDKRCRSEEHTSELQSQFHLVCRLLLEKKK